MFFALAYSSRSLVDFDDESLLELADCAAAKNEKISVTGYLYYRDGTFLQYIEGEQSQVEMLMAKISQDPRHELISTHVLPKIPELVFPHWYMRFLSSDLPARTAPTLEDELTFILDNTSADEDVTDAIVHVTSRIASLDWQ